MFGLEKRRFREDVKSVFEYLKSCLVEGGRCVPWCSRARSLSSGLGKELGESACNVKLVAEQMTENKTQQIFSLLRISK